MIKIKGGDVTFQTSTLPEQQFLAAMESSPIKFDFESKDKLENFLRAHANGFSASALRHGGRAVNGGARLERRGSELEAQTVRPDGAQAPADLEARIRRLLGNG